MSNNIISLEAGEDGKLKRKTDVLVKDSYSSLFTNEGQSDTIKEIALAYNENASSKNSGDRGDSMSDENFSVFFKDIKDDMREREARTKEDTREREDRFEKTLTKFYEDNKDREERLLALTEDIKRENRELKHDIKYEMNRLSEEINSTRQEISNLTKHNESLATTNKWSNVATIIGISSIVVAVIVALITFFIML